MSESMTHAGPPAWHDRPPVPGYYVIRIADPRMGDSHYGSDFIDIQNTEAAVEWFRGRRWYGPIPRDPEARP